MRIKKKNYFIITIDTEGDNEWEGKEKATTENAKYLPRFQEVCEKYSFKPTYLLTYEMANDTFLIDYLKQKLNNNLCEIGAHLHSWSNPPFDFKLPNENINKPYIFEYPLPVQAEKLSYLTKAIYSNFNIKPISYKAGRWGINMDHFNLLAEEGFLVDTSYCPGINWKTSRGYKKGGNDYSLVGIKPFQIRCNSKHKILEIPQTIIPLGFAHNYSLFSRLQVNLPMMNKFLKLFKQEFTWLRPFPHIDGDKLINVAQAVLTLDINVMQITFHSSELMQNGSPYNKTAGSIDELYNKLNLLFSFLYNQNVTPVTLSGYCNYYNSVTDRW